VSRLEQPEHTWRVHQTQPDRHLFMLGSDWRSEVLVARGPTPREAHRNAAKILRKLADKIEEEMP
jgi:hypothetical protein